MNSGDQTSKPSIEASGGTNRSLQSIILIRVLPATALCLFLILAITQHNIHKTLEQEVNSRLTQAAALTTEQLASQLSMLRASASGLAANDLIVNSIIDKNQRDYQLPVFFRSLRMPNASFRRITMTDYAGRVIVSGRKNEDVDVSNFLSTVMSGDDYYAITPRWITVAAPVKYSNKPEAVLAVQYDTVEFFKNFQSIAPGQQLRLSRDGEILYQSQPESRGSSWSVASQSVTGYPELIVQRAESAELAFSAMRSLNWFLFVVLIAAMIAVLMGIVAASIISTRPLAKMISQILAIESTNDLSQRVNANDSTEFQHLTVSFNSMIETLSRTTVSMDQLQASESRMRTVVESVPSGIIVADTTGTITSVNAQTESTFGYRREELVGMRLEAIVPGAISPTGRYQNQYASGSKLRTSLYGKHKDGHRVPVEVGLNQVELAEGPGILASVIDLTESRAKDLAIAESEERLSLAVSSADIGLWDWDVASNEVRISKELSAQVGEEVAYRDFDGWRERLHPDDVRTAEQAANHCFRGITPFYETTFRLRHRDGSYRWILSRGKVALDAEDEPHRMIGVHVDITDRKRDEEALRSANARLLRSNEELEQFAYVASHDLQEPLRIVTAYCELLREDCYDALTEDGHRYMKYVIDGAKRMRTLIQDLLAYSSVETKGRTPTKVDANDAAKKAAVNLQELIEQSKAEITFDLLPTVDADPTQLGDLFQTLIGNAIKYRGDVEPQVHISAKSQPSDWLFQIRDNGIGIEPQYRDKIFGIFKRLHSRDKYQGNGIGLAICKRIVDRLQGKIWVESELGKGSSFFVSIPKGRA